MGIYLNPGNQQFIKAMNSPYFVDKSEMILFLNSVLNTEQMDVSVSRPRRFGKSMAVNMLCAYYEKDRDSRELFEKTKLCSHTDWDKYLGKYDVLLLTMTDFFKADISVEESLLKMQRLLFRDIKKAFPEIDFYDPQDITLIMSDIYAETNRQFVILIDEWDAVFRERKYDREGQEKYLDFLRDWLKNKPYIALAYMTGILPIKKYGKHSALNMFDEYSMIAPMQLARYTGFTEDEVRNLCEKYNMSYSDISDWYDGYRAAGPVPVEMREAYRKGTYSEHRISLYSPLSVVSAISSGLIRNYWNKTENYEALSEYIRMDYDGLKETVALLMDGGHVHADLRRYQNDMTSFNSRDDVLALLIHLGYLGYDEEAGEVFIPNKEILDEFKSSTSTEVWQPVFESFRMSQQLLEATWNGDADTVASVLENVHDRTSNKSYHNEAALSYAIVFAYYAAQKYYTVVPEFDTGKGYADVVFIPSPKYPEKPAMVVELKYNKAVKTGIDQIRTRNYPERLEHYKGNILLIAVSYEKDRRSDDRNFKHHTCIIEKA